MKSDMLVEEVIKRLLKEAAKTFDDAVTDNLRLHKEPTMTGFRVVLYRNIPKDGYRDFQIYGYLALTDQRKSCSTWRVASVASERGYGALMYDIGMSIVSPDFVRADDSTRPAAMSIWKGILGSHSSKYEILPYDYNQEENGSDCKTAVEPQVKVRIKQPLDVNSLVDSSLEGHEGREIIQLGMDYFGKRYRETK